jgi:hypothetical protein
MTWRTAIGLKVFFVGRPFGLLPSLGTARQTRVAGARARIAFRTPSVATSCSKSGKLDR